MRRVALAVTVLATITLTGCAGDPDGPKTVESQCASVTSSWEQFKLWITTHERNDQVMENRRTVMLDTWEDVAEAGPAWTHSTVGLAVDNMREFIDAPGSMSNAVDLWQTVDAQIDLYRSQCVEDGNL